MSIVHGNDPQQTFSASQPDWRSIADKLAKALVFTARQLKTYHGGSSNDCLMYADARDALAAYKEASNARDTRS